jgi:hypothetical protein
MRPATDSASKRPWEDSSYTLRQAGGTVSSDGADLRRVTNNAPSCAGGADLSHGAVTIDVQNYSSRRSSSTCMYRGRQSAPDPCAGRVVTERDAATASVGRRTQVGRCGRGRRPVVPEPHSNAGSRPTNIGKCLTLSVANAVPYASAVAAVT